MLYYAGRDPAGHSTDRNLVETGAQTYVLHAAGAGPLRWTGNFLSTSDNSVTFRLNAAVTGNDNVFGGVISANTSFPARSVSFDKVGAGAWVLTAANTYTGNTTLRAGTLRLDFSATGAPAANIIAPTTVGSFFSYGSVLAVKGKDSASNSQLIESFTLREGQTSVELTPGSGGSLAVNLGNTTFARAPFSGITPGSVLNVNPNGGTVSTSLATTTNGVLSSSGIAFATVNKTDWATLSGGNIVALGSYQTATDPTAWAASDNVSLAANPDTAVGTRAINTLRMTASSAVDIGAGNILEVGAGGILITGSGVNTISNGTLRGGGTNPYELIVIQNNTANAATISSVIANSTAGATGFTKAGPGTLYLTGTNNYTLQTTVADGVLVIGSLNNIGSGSSRRIKLSGGIVGLTANITFAGFGATGNSVEFLSSGGFAAYGGNWTATVSAAQTLSSSTELWLSAPDADGTIFYSPSSLALNNDSASEPSLRTIRVFDGSAAVDADITAPILNTSGANATKSTLGIFKAGPGVLRLSSSSANMYSGPTIVAEGGLIVTGSIANSMLTEVRDGAWLGGNGTVSSIEIHPGAKLAPGTSIGTLSTQNNGNGYFLWNGETNPAAPGQLQFELSTVDNTSDLLNLGTSEFLKGTGSVFKFDFMGGGKAGETYTLIQWGTKSAAWAVDDFSYENLGSGLSGSFALNSSDLQFTVIPEPGTVGMALAGLALMALRRRLRG